ncbi:hypothetical protein JCM15415_01150 [Methanobacterium movens]
MKNKGIITLTLLLVVGVVLFSGCTDSGSSTEAGAESRSNLKVSDVEVVSEGYGMYKIKATIMPEKDYSYLEMVLIWYDDSGAVIDKNPLAWNINDVKSGQALKITGTGILTGDEAPAKVDILIFDSVFSGGDESGAIYKSSVTL